MRKRINVTLSEETVRLLDRVARKGDRSQLIDQAVRTYVAKVGRANLRRQIREGALRHAERDLALAEEWFPLENEAWQRRRDR